MKKKHRRTLANIARINGGTHWSDVEALLTTRFGAEVYEGTGATVTFVIDDLKLTVDRPHPRRHCGKGLVKRVKTYLEELGRL